MPVYEFRCSACGARRDVRATYAAALTLELVCVNCGDTMTKAISRSFTVASGASPSPSSTNTTTPPKRHTHADGVVKLSRPNPFKEALPAASDADQGER